MATSKYKVLSPIDLGEGRVEPSERPVEIDDKVAAALVAAKAVERIEEKQAKK